MTKLEQFDQKWRPKIRSSIPHHSTTHYMTWCLFYTDGEKHQSPYLTREELIECCFEYLYAMKHVKEVDRQRLMTTLRRASFLLYNCFKIADKRWKGTGCFDHMGFCKKCEYLNNSCICTSPTDRASAFNRAKD